MHADIMLKIVKIFLFKCVLYKFEAKFSLLFNIFFMTTMIRTTSSIYSGNINELENVTKYI